MLIQTLELVQRVLDESIAAGIKIDCIVLSGGASQMPMVMNGLKELVEDEYPVILYRPSEAVSFGAARFANGILRPDTVISIPTQITGKKKEKEPSEIIVTAKKKPSEKKDVTPVKKTNQIIDQLTDCCYGIWMPLEDRLEGEVEFVIQSGIARPSTSNALEIYTASSRVIIKVYRSKIKNRNLKSATIDDCDSILWVPFDVVPNSRYKVSITALENYGIEVELYSETGEAIKKTTSDKLSKLL